jgi:signal transduction histidine kinase
LNDVTRFRLLDQVKSDLVATVSHELKTPLTSIRLDHHLLLEEAAGPLAQKQVELLLDARENSDRLLSMVNNLLDLARIEGGSQYLELKPESPGMLLKTAVEAIQPRADDKDINIVLGIPPDLPLIDADSQRLGHALGNLLDNALNHTGRGGRITLGAQTDGEEVTLSVTDTGTGIPSQYLPHLFDRFFRIPGQSKVSGTGLGLAIVREIVTAHGGTITCESQPGQGTTFNIRLPARRLLEATTNDE